MNFSSADLIVVEEKTGLLTYARPIAVILCTVHKEADPFVLFHGFSFWQGNLLPFLNLY